MQIKGREALAVWLALFAASIASSTVFSIAIGMFAFWWLAFIVSLFHALIFGIPMYAFFVKTNRTQWFMGVFGGLLIGFIPVSVLCLMAFIHEDSWNNALGTILSCGGLGSVGGFAAWITWKFVKEAHFCRLKGAGRH